MPSKRHHTYLKEQSKSPVKILTKYCGRLRQPKAGVTLNISKYAYRESEVRFLVRTVSAEAVIADPDREQDVTQIDAAKDTFEVTSFLASPNYLVQFLLLLAARQPFETSFVKMSTVLGSGTAKSFHSVKKEVNVTRVLVRYATQATHIVNARIILWRKCCSPETVTGGAPNSCMSITFTILGRKE